MRRRCASTRARATCGSTAAGCSSPRRSTSCCSASPVSPSGWSRRGSCCTTWGEGGRARVWEMLQANERSAAAVDLPVTGDLEHGYGDPVGTAGEAWRAGLVGINFEDSTHEGHVPLEEQLAMIRAIREAVPPLVINARVDVFIRETGGIDEAVQRGNAYL